MSNYSIDHVPVSWFGLEPNPTELNQQGLPLGHYIGEQRLFAGGYLRQWDGASWITMGVTHEALKRRLLHKMAEVSSRLHQWTHKVAGCPSTTEVREALEPLLTALDEAEGAVKPVEPNALKSPFESALIERLDKIQPGVTTEANYSTLSTCLTVYYQAPEGWLNAYAKNIWVGIAATNAYAENIWVGIAATVVQEASAEFGLRINPSHMDIRPAPATWRTS